MMNDLSFIRKSTLNAIREVYVRDHYLIHNGTNNHVSEQSIMFRMGYYLARQLSLHELFRHFDVDMEYNRNGDRPKYLREFGNGVIPDLIIHKRGKNTANLLVVEAKTWWNEDEHGIWYDKDKIRNFTNNHGEYDYKFGLFIVFRRDYAELFWMINGQDGKIGEAKDYVNALGDGSKLMLNQSLQASQ